MGQEQRRLAVIDARLPDQHVAGNQRRRGSTALGYILIAPLVMPLINVFIVARISKNMGMEAMT